MDSTTAGLKDWRAVDLKATMTVEKMVGRLGMLMVVRTGLSTAEQLALQLVLK